VSGEALGGALARSLRLRRLRALRRCDRVGGRERRLVGEEKRGEPLLELELDVVGEHAEEDVRAISKRMLRAVRRCVAAIEITVVHRSRRERASYREHRAGEFRDPALPGSGAKIAGECRGERS